MGCILGKKGRNSEQSLNVRNKNAPKNLQAKVVLIGNSGVGKTSIAQSYKDGRVSSNISATIGASYFEKSVFFKDQSSLKLNIWDTGGQEKHRAVNSLYYKGAHAALVCYSVCDQNSFRCLEEWLK